MPLTGHEGARTYRRQQPRQRALQALAWSLALAGLAACMAVIAARTHWEFVLDAPSVAADLTGRMWPPSWTYIRVLLRPLWDTLNIATLGTLLGLALATPLGFLAASNVTPHPLVRAVTLVL